MCRPDAGKALSFRFDHGAEVVSTQSTLLLEIGSDGQQVIVGQGLAQKQAVGLAACFGFRAECGMRRMRRQHGIRKAVAVGRANRPWIFGRIIRHARADRIEVDVSLALQYVAFAVDQAGLVAAFPQDARSLVAGIELADLTAPAFLPLFTGAWMAVPLAHPLTATTARAPAPSVS